MEREWIAHTSEHENETLLEHLHLTAFLAERYGDKFHSGKVCRTAALLHDIGKRTENGRIELFCAILPLGLI